MLAKAPPSISQPLKPSRTSPLIHHAFISPRLRSHRCGAPTTRVSIRASYTRKPMDTPGAYQLIDDDTGEKFIVWGGVDEDDTDAPIPSKEVLSWKPPSGEGKRRKSGEDIGGGEILTAYVTDVDHALSVAVTNDSTKSCRGFDRLKVQKVRALTRTMSLSKQENVGNNYEYQELKDDSSDEWFSSESEDECVEEKRNLNASRNKNSTLKLMPSSNNFKKTAEPEEDNLYLKGNEQDFDMEESYVSSPRAAASASFRGWNSGTSIPNSAFDSNNRLKQRKKITSDSTFFSRKSFRDLGCSEEVIKSLKGQRFVRPSHIQALAFTPVVNEKSCIIADQSGSGKTLAYLAPLIQRLRQEELQGLSKSSSRSPRAVVLVPTAELATQVLNNCRSMSKCGVPFRSMVATGGFRQRTQLEGLQQDLDILIATPGRFTFLLKEGFLQLTNLKCIVLDEVDILFGDEGFEQVLQSLVNSAPVTSQYLFVTATLPVDIYNKLVEIFPDCDVIMGPGIHRTSSGLEEVLVDCSGDDRVERSPETAFLNKKSALLQLLKESPVSRTIIFCNKIETCRKVENVFKRYDRKGIHIKVLPFHSALAQENRLANMKAFLNHQSSEESSFLICTDRASRGIDFPCVDHVVLFDFPRDPSEYVRRVGRTARGAGGKGKAFVFVVGKQVSLARRIMERNQRGHPIHDVPSAYELVN
ncbi:hypothetical protein Sjap_004971 [Stephania japonica]|uniref:DEAD-box ATP-dependent RNA helicase 50 n=1 Tax=Stephania japonica TaxID=461633 RepID=A0AAP0K4Q2_9MAGN